MKISYRTHPILKSLETGSLGTIPVNDEDRDLINYIDLFREMWKRYRHEFAKEITLFSDTFHNCFEKSREKIFQLSNDILEGNTGEKKDLTISGTYIIGPYVHMIYHDFSPDSDFFHIAHFAFHKDGTPISCHVVPPDPAPEMCWITKRFGDYTNRHEDAQKILVRDDAEIFGLIVFSRFAEIEAKHINSGKKVKGFKCHYKNEIGLDVVYVDSNWFRELVRSEGFTVRGHFRLQPKKKDGKWTRELIWINDFQKSGYRRRAEKEIYEKDP